VVGVTLCDWRKLYATAWACTRRLELQTIDYVDEVFVEKFVPCMLLGISRRFFELDQTRYSYFATALMTLLALKIINLNMLYEGSSLTVLMTMQLDDPK